VISFLIVTQQSLQTEASKTQTKRQQQKSKKKKKTKRGNVSDG
jgi:hypothetical protein